MMIQKQIIQMTALVMLSAGIALAVNAFRPAPLPLTQDWDFTIAERNRANISEELIILDLAAMQDAYQREDVIVVDARSRDFYDFEHIPGALSLPLENSDQLTPEFIKTINPNHRVITYCDSSTCPMAEELAAKLKAAGHADTAVYIGGVTEWMDQGLPVESDS